MSKLGAIGSRILSPISAFSELEAAFRLLQNGHYLKQVGWFRSRREQLAVDKNGRPIPWYTYPAIYFLDSRISKEMNVFEFGSGQSTLWWASKARYVTSCEDDPQWATFVRQKLPDNAKLLLHPKSRKAEYSNAARTAGKRFEIIVIDGIERQACTEASITALTDDGVFIFDNSQHPDNKEANDLLERAAFRRIDFAGISPINAWDNVTTIFYRDHNCLHI